jgi:hypothetical protein
MTCGDDVKWEKPFKILGTKFLANHFATGPERQVGPCDIKLQVNGFVYPNFWSTHFALFDTRIVSPVQQNHSASFLAKLTRRSSCVPWGFAVLKSHFYPWNPKDFRYRHSRPYRSQKLLWLHGWKPDLRTRDGMVRLNWLLVRGKPEIAQSFLRFRMSNIRLRPYPPEEKHKGGDFWTSNTSGGDSWRFSNGSVSAK